MTGRLRLTSVCDRAIFRQVRQGAWTLIVAAALCLALLVPSARAQYKYQLTDLGAFTPVAVNKLGLVAGEIRSVLGLQTVFHAALYRYGEIVDISNTPINSSALGMNSHGDVSGDTLPLFGSGFSLSAVLFTNGKTLSISRGTSQAIAVNDAGQVLVSSFLDGFFLYHEGTFTRLQIPGIGAIVGMNNRGEFIGLIYDYPVQYRGTLFSNGVVTTLGSLGGQVTHPLALNDRTEVVGYSTIATGQERPFLYAKGILTNLGTPPVNPALPAYPLLRARGLNNFGQIIIEASTDTSPAASRPFLYENGAMTDLNTLTDLAGSPFSELQTVVSISDGGFIVGVGLLKSGVRHGYMLAPIPLPPPQWWTTRGVIDPGKTPNDFAPANQGQAKNLARKAYDELQLRLAGGAGPGLTQLIASWNAAANATDYAAINQGQLKNLAKLFYDRLAEAGYHGPPLQSGQVYPWSALPAGELTGDDRSFAPANLGQLKNLFAFDLGGANTDSDNDGLPDWWERWHFTTLAAQNAAGNPDADSFTNAQELSAGTNPTVPNP